MKLINAVIIDHENDTVQLLQKFAKENAMIISICGSDTKFEIGIEMIKKKRPELIFFNACEANLNFFELIDNIDFVAPKFIFMSNEKKDAYHAYKLNAVGFLLKPLRFNDIILAVYNVMKICEIELSFQKIQLQKIDFLNASRTNQDYVAISSNNKIELLKTDDIIYCQSEGKYTEFKLTDGAKILSTKNLGEYVNTINQNYFFRIHHSYLINIKHIVKITKKDGFHCEFSDGTILPVAKRRMDRFTQFIKQ
ncbi:LytR/AlgR family response regulator transcription factor [Arenibacter algicola]|uniref:LytR/AlgR family response regulator transcription factor n=1 Tax=Arenibacter algicola TaxID=616991 RepID=UPI0004DF4569|nr:response regulator transcription factor [Arenibacter algicola]